MGKGTGCKAWPAFDRGPQQSTLDCQPVPLQQHPIHVGRICETLSRHTKVAMDRSPQLGTQCVGERLAEWKGAHHEHLSATSDALGVCWLQVQFMLEESSLHDAPSTRPTCCQPQKLIKRPHQALQKGHMPAPAMESLGPSCPTLHYQTSPRSQSATLNTLGIPTDPGPRL